MMATSMAVVVLCPNGRRQIVKVTQNTSILHVLEEACQRQGINPQDYDIKHFKQTLDPSLTVRFANLPNNAQLELCATKRLRQDSSVTVALQLESGERLTKDFNPSSSLWDLIMHWEKNRDGNILKDINEGDPVCIYMRTEIIGENSLKQTSLRNLGLTGGKVVIRLLYRPADLLGYQAHDTTPLPKRPFEEKPSSSLICPSQNQNQCIEMFSEEQMKSPYLQPDDLKDSVDNNELKYNNDQLSASSQTNFSKDNEKTLNSPRGKLVNNTEIQNTFPSDDVQMEEDSMDTSEETKEQDNIIIIGERNAVVFNLEDVPKLKQVDLPDDFFELTVEDARYLLADLKRQRIALEEQPLETSSQRVKRQQNLADVYNHTILRIHFPDRLVIQACFGSNETVKTVMDFVRNFLSQPHSDFYLYTTPPKTTLSTDITLARAHLVPAAVIHFGSRHMQCHYLKDEVRSQLSTLSATHQAAFRSRKEFSHEHQTATHSSHSNQKSQPVLESTYQPQSKNSERKDKSTKVPQWFKQGKK